MEQGGKVPMKQGARYPVGMYGGSFNPLHMGHLSCIIQAANMCEELYVVISVGENRNEVSYRVRYRWIYQLTKHIGNVKLLPLIDPIENKKDYNEKQWKKDCEFVKEKIGKPIDIVFCGDDYNEDSFWNVCYPESQFYIFPRNEISSTQIRENPYKHWDWIPNIVKTYYNKKVLLIGGESTGKSTLTINLANYFNTNYIDEAGREISERSGTDLMMLTKDFTEILLQHKMNELKAIEHSNKVLFIDTDALITHFYIQFLDDPGKEKNIALAQAIDTINQYDLILFLEPDVEFVQDGDRSTVIRDDRTTYSNQIKQIFREHGRNFIEIQGDYQERFLAAVNAVEKLLQ